MRNLLRVWAFVGTQFIVSLPSFAQWEPDRQITNYPGHSDYGSYNNAWTIAVQDSLVHIVWEHRTGGSANLYYVQSTDYGANFGPHQQLTAGNSHFPSICVSDSFVHIARKGNKDGNSEIYYNRSGDYGLTWDIDNFRLINDDAGSWNPSICCSDSCVHIAWLDDRNGNNEIYYNRSNNYGVSWAGDERLTFNANIFFKYMSVACTKCPYDVHIAWTDERDDNQEIYYKRHKCPGSGIEEDKKFRVESLEFRVYPNPSFGNAVIKYGLSEKASITLGLYDITGRLVKTLYSGNQEKGYHKVNVEVYHDTPTGIYFIKFETHTGLATNNYKATRKLTIIR